MRGLVFGYPINRVLNFAFARFIELSMTKSDIARRCMGWLDGKIFKCYMLNIDRHWAQRIRKFGNVVQYVHPFYTDLAVEIHLNQSIIVQYFYKQINDV